jgi:hypothetical protein
MNTCPPRPVPTAPSAFAGFFFPADVIVLAVRWYLRFGLSYRDVEELLAERGSRSTTSPSTGGSSGSRRCWPRPPGPAATISLLCCLTQQPLPQQAVKSQLPTAAPTVPMAVVSHHWVQGPRAPRQAWRAR